MRKITLTLALVFSQFALADNCDKPRDDFDGLYCLNKVYQESDKELNNAYTELRSYLNKDEKKKLKRTQVSWIKQRNSKCSLRQNDGFYVDLSCTTETTISRTNVLRDRIRECKSTDCQPSKL